MNAVPLLRLVARALATIVLLYSSFSASARALAEWNVTEPAPERLRRAIEWDSQNPGYYVALSRVLRDSPQGADSGEVIRLLESATRLSPYKARYWTELGGALELAGRLEDAQRAYERAQQLFPNSPVINWQLGNFYLRQGNLTPALRALQKVLVGDPNLRLQTFDLAWRAGAEPAAILTEMIPPRGDVLFPYLRYLVDRDQIDAASAVWERIIALQLPMDPREAFPYLDALIRNKRVAVLAEAWRSLAKQNPTRIRQRAFDRSLITNADFESEILNGGLDWRIDVTKGVVVSTDSLNFFDGTRSLKIQFDGTRNLDYAHIAQFVLVKPGSLYHFAGYMRTDRITTDSGPHFQIYDPDDISGLFLSSESLVGTSTWTPLQLRFRTGPATRLLVIRLARHPSRKLDNLIAGTVWIDHLSLTAAE